MSTSLFLGSFAVGTKNKTDFSSRDFDRGLLSSSSSETTISSYFGALTILGSTRKNWLKMASRIFDRTEVFELDGDFSEI